MIKKFAPLMFLLLIAPPVMALTTYLQILNPNDYDLSNFQVKVNLSTYGISPPIASIQLTNGTTIPFCYEQPNGECNQTESNIIWVKIPLIRAKDYTAIKIISDGTNGAVSGDQVFDFYDDFNGNELDTNKWTVDSNNGFASVQSGYLKLTVTTTDANSYASVLSTQKVNLPLVLVMRFRMDGSDMLHGRHDAVLKHDADNSVHIGFDIRGTSNPFQYWHITCKFEGTSCWTELYDSQYDPSSNWITIEAVILNNHGTIYKLPEKTKLEEASISFNYNDVYVGVLHWYSAASTYTDFIIVRKYADQDPIVKQAYARSSLSPQSPSPTQSEYSQTYRYVRQVTLLPENLISVSNAQVILTLDTQSLISDGKMKSDCSDIYITYYDPLYGELPAKFWVDPTTCNSPNTRIYVKLPTVSINNDWILNIYYGSPDAIPVWDPKNTFVFYVDLSNPSDINNNLIIRSEGSTSISYTPNGLQVNTGSDGRIVIINK